MNNHVRRCDSNTNPNEPCPAILISHPTGNANVRAVLNATSSHGLLESFWTTLAIHPTVTRCVPNKSLRRSLGRRTFDEVPWDKVRYRTGRELVRLFARRLGLRSLVRHESGWASVDQVYRHVDRRVAAYVRTKPLNLRGVYAYEDGARETFRAAKVTGSRCFYDLPTAHWRTWRHLMVEEAELRPNWAMTIRSLRDGPHKLEAKDEEISLADRIIVASEFTKNSLTGHFGPDLPVDVVPYGAPPPDGGVPYGRGPGEALQVFFAGNLGQAKGLAYLIEGLKRLDRPWRITLAGALPDFMPDELNKFLQDSRCRWLGHIPHATLLEQLRKAHVFVFPSLIEGFGMVLYEAMSAGLPVITTPNTAAPDIMTDGHEGFIIPIRAPDVIADRLTALYEDEPKRQEMAAAALTTATASGWEHYEARILDLIRDAL